MILGRNADEHPAQGGRAEGEEMFNANSSILQTLGHFSPSRKPLGGALAKDCGEDSMSDGAS